MLCGCACISSILATLIYMHFVTTSVCCGKNSHLFFSSSSSASLNHMSSNSALTDQKCVSRFLQPFYLKYRSSRRKQLIGSVNSNIKSSTKKQLPNYHAHTNKLQCTTLSSTTLPYCHVITTYIYTNISNAKLHTHTYVHREKQEGTSKPLFLLLLRRQITLYLSLFGE